MSTIDEILASAIEFKDEIDLDSDDFLEHYGRKGMHWYQHIFGDKDSRAQYANGSGTGDSKKSSGSNKNTGSSNSKEAIKQQHQEEKTKRKAEKAAAKESKRQAKEEARAKAKVEAEAKAKVQAEMKAKAEEEYRKRAYEEQKQRDLRDANSIYKNRNKYSKEEIAEAVQRVKWERELSNLRWDQGMQVKRRVDDIAGSLETGTRIYNDFAKIFNTFSGDDGTKLPIVGEKRKKRNNSNSGGGDDD